MSAFDDWWDEATRLITFFDCKKGCRDLCQKAWSAGTVHALGAFCDSVEEATDDLHRDARRSTDQAHQHPPKDDQPDQAHDHQ